MISTAHPQERSARTLSHHPLIAKLFQNSPRNFGRDLLTAFRSRASHLDTIPKPYL